jgi:nitroimidazol reductase NimA-like FMN-containing flavoprotein (pyridoxamine 5'-phosphate oxidase superfamily)
VSAKRPTDEDLDPGSLDEIESDECWRLLATQPIGRVGVIVGQYPLIFPVNYAVVGEQIVFQTGAGTKLWATNRSNVTFEVDELDLVHRSGWSVMVRGAAHEVSVERNPILKERAEVRGAVPWAPGPRNHLVRMVADQISGRRIRPAELPPATDLRGYL